MQGVAEIVHLKVALRPIWGRFPADARHLQKATGASDKSWGEREVGRSLDLAIRQMFK